MKKAHWESCGNGGDRESRKRGGVSERRGEKGGEAQCGALAPQHMYQRHYKHLGFI